MSLPKRLFIANRGEIAVRIIRTCQSLGIETVWPATAEDLESLASREVDRIVELTSSSDYLDGPKLVTLAIESGCDAVHPGYGYLSERVDFASAVTQAKLLWIGPGEQALKIMGDKLAAREAMVAAGVPVVPGVEDLSDPNKALVEVGLPALLKPSGGGGGKGMVVIKSAEGFAEALESCRSQAVKAFADDRVHLERWIPKARHVEVQVMADCAGTVQAFGTRDCSVQRRHQKVIEECPAPELPEDIAASFEKAAVNAAKAVDYVGAGTVEFILTADNEFFFLEMNTRLQVEHPVTEEVYGVDLVALQLRCAAGESLQSVPIPRGHAIEARLYAEDPDQNFLPCTGRINFLHVPTGPGIRVDSSVISGSQIGLDFDPMFLKIIALGADREEARRRLSSALRELVVHGVGHNGRFLLDVLNHDDFCTVKHHTRWLEGLPLGQFSGPDEAHWLTLAVAAGSQVSSHRDSGERGVSSAFLEGLSFRFSGTRS